MIPGDFQIRKPSRIQVLILGILGIGGLVGAVVGLVLGAFVITAWLGLPLDVFGLNEGPEQPIAFPHTTHVKSLGMDCTFCHRNVTVGAAASVPAVGLCMTCHKTIGDGNEEISKLRDYHSSGLPINWVRVHRVPDHVNFIHEPHIRHFGEKYGGPAGTCQLCHGDVGRMVKVKQVRSLKMGDGVDCHKANDAPTDCTTCHY